MIILLKNCPSQSTYLWYKMLEILFLDTRKVGSLRQYRDVMYNTIYFSYNLFPLTCLYLTSNSVKKKNVQEIEVIVLYSEIKIT